ncbi:MAG: HD domain-containing protein [Armatimonadetes bacterium]|nr:HD domain-containing protein [Armatimonadota bacterium]
MKNSYISGLHEGVRVDDVFLICSKSLGCKQDGSPYIKLKLSDRTGAIDAIKWDASEQLYAGLTSDDCIRVRGTVTTYNGRLQIRVDSLRRHTQEIDPSDFLPRSERDIDDMLACLRKIIESVEHHHLRAVLDYFFSDQDFVSRFSTAPAALRIHHGYIGGLLEHTLSVAELCLLVTSHYPSIDRDLLVTGAILHDIGKIEEFCWDRTIKYSDSGHFIGHIVAGTLMVSEAIDSIQEFAPLLKLVVKHMIVAHHGQKDWGSPKRPKSIESLILHYLEDMDAKVNTFQQAIAGGDVTDNSNVWTDRHWIFDRPLFRGLPSASPSPGLGDLSGLSEETYDPFAEE